MSEAALREDLARLCKSLFDRGFSVGSAGNVSVRLDDGYLITPTNSCLGFLDPARISRLDRHGNHIGGDKPSKEVFLHRAFYETRPAAVLLANHGPVVSGKDLTSAVYAAEELE